MAAFAVSCKLDPGEIKPQIDFIKLLEIYEDIGQLCPECLVIRTVRSRHCNVCKRCVDRFDHHCNWINNCVGIRNHNVFLTYIYSQLSLLLIILLSTLTAMGSDLIERWSTPSRELVESRVGGVQLFLFSESTVMFYLSAVQIVTICLVFLPQVATLVYY